MKKAQNSLGLHTPRQTQTVLHWPWAGSRLGWRMLRRAGLPWLDSQIPHLCLTFFIFQDAMPGTFEKLGHARLRAFRSDCLKTSPPDTFSFASAGQLPPSSAVKIPGLCFLLIPSEVAKSSSTHTLSNYPSATALFNHMKLEDARIFKGHRE